MRLLIVTQKIDEEDDVLGFMHAWIGEFAKHAEAVISVGLFVGVHHLPKNVSVYSLGKGSSEHGSPVRFPRFFRRIFYAVRFLRIIFLERKNYDVVFVHMNPEYVAIGGALWKLFGKKIGLWYAHGHVPWTLRVAEKFSDIIFTSTKSGCRIDSKKIQIMGQGIDANRFLLKERKSPRNPPRVLLLGRISPAKRIEILLSAFALLPGAPLLEIAGGPQVPSDEQYLSELHVLAERLKIAQRIVWTGAVPFVCAPEVFERADVFASPSSTGSFDKAGGDAMATGLPVVISNIAYREVFGALTERLMFQEGDIKEFAKKIQEVFSLDDSERKILGVQLREIIVQCHSLEHFVKKIISAYHPPRQSPSRKESATIEV